MDIHQIPELIKLTDERIIKAREYKDYRFKAAQAKVDLDIMLAAELSEFRAKKSNVGYDMAILMLMEKDAHAADLHRKYVENRAKYKALEKIIDAIQSKLSFHQSIMRYQREND